MFIIKKFRAICYVGYVGSCIPSGYIFQLARDLDMSFLFTINWIFGLMNICTFTNWLEWRLVQSQNILSFYQLLIESLRVVNKLKKPNTKTIKSNKNNSDRNLATQLVNINPKTIHSEVGGKLITI